MLKVGEHVDKIHLKEGEIASAILAYQHNRAVLLEGSNIVDFGAAANTNIVLGWAYYAKWRVAGLGFRCHTENFTDAEDPELAFGSAADPDLFGKLKVTYPANEKMVIGDVASETVGNLLSSILAEAETGITFSMGAINGRVNWQTSPLEISVENIAQLTTGQGYPFVLIEIDAGGKY